MRDAGAFAGYRPASAAGQTSERVKKTGPPGNHSC